MKPNGFMLWISDREPDKNGTRLTIGSSIINGQIDEKNMSICGITKVEIKIDEAKVELAKLGILAQSSAEKTANDKELFNVLISELAQSEDNMLLVELMNIIDKSKYDDVIILIKDGGIHTNVGPIDALVVSEVAQRLGAKL